MMHDDLHWVIPLWVQYKLVVTVHRDRARILTVSSEQLLCIRSTNLAKKLINAHQLPQRVSCEIVEVVGQYIVYLVIEAERLAQRRAASSCNASQFPPFLV